MRLLSSITFSLIIILFFSSCLKTKNESEKYYSNILDDNKDLEPYPEKIIAYDKLSFGNGYNSSTSQEFYGTIEYENTDNSTEILSKAYGNTGFVEIKSVDNKYQLKNTLDISTKVDLNLKIKGFSSENTFKSRVYKESTFSSFDQTVVIKAKYVNEPRIIINPKIRKELIQLAKESPIDFMKRNGDMFVSKIYTGGEVYAYLKLHSRDRHEKERNEKFIKSINSYVGNKLSIESKTISTKDEKNTSNFKQAYVFTAGGGKTPNELNMDKFLDFASNFKEQVNPKAKPVILYVELSPYESLPDFPKIDFSPIRVKQKEFLENSALLYTSIEESIQNSKYVIENPKYFERTDFNQSNDTITFYKEKLKELKNLVELCKGNFENCTMSALDSYAIIEKYSPIIDYPYNISSQKQLSVDTNNQQLIIDNTLQNGHKYYLTIKGSIKSRPHFNDSNAICKDPVFDYEYKWVGTKKKVKKRFLRKTKRWYYPIYQGYSKPYFLIQIINPNTNEILRKINWTGDPIALEDNVKVTATLVNPNIGIFYQKNNQLIHQYSESYPMYRGLQNCYSLRAVISDNSVPAMQTFSNALVAPLSSNIIPPTSDFSINKVNQENPKFIKKDDNFYGYEYE
ncbi:hypothetical protein [Aquimarina sp. SS2-1]|uniref:hypothetical protein n=1 Tax=Aquimarina besae TaxID=3342247 RepID=UPI00366BAECF